MPPTYNYRYNQSIDNTDVTTSIGNGNSNGNSQQTATNKLILLSLLSLLLSGFVELSSLT